MTFGNRSVLLVYIKHHKPGHYYTAKSPRLAASAAKWVPKSMDNEPEKRSSGGERCSGGLLVFYVY